MMSEPRQTAYYPRPFPRRRLPVCPHCDRCPECGHPLRGSWFPTWGEAAPGYPDYPVDPETPYPPRYVVVT